MNEESIPETSTDEETIAQLEAAVQLKNRERLECVYVFDPVVRRETAFSLALITKRLDDERLEMVAIGERSVGAANPARDFIRRARFPAEILPLILEEFIDRCGVEGASYREVHIETQNPSEQLSELAALVSPRTDVEPSPAQ
jgi:hypothetical protein